MDENLSLRMATLFCSMLDMILNGFVFSIQVAKENINGKEQTKVMDVVLATTTSIYTIICMFLCFSILLKKSCAFVPWLFLQPIVLLIYFVCLLLQKWNQMTEEDLEMWGYMEVIHDVLIHFYMVGIWVLVYNYFKILKFINYGNQYQRLNC